MSNLLLDSDATSEFFGDLAITNNSLSLTSGKQSIEQHLTTRLKLFFGEWFLDTTLGVPWFQDILKKQASFTVVSEVLKNYILDTPGILNLLSFNFEYTATTREITLSFSAVSTEGVIDFSLLDLN